MIIIIIIIIINNINNNSAHINTTYVHILQNIIKDMNF